MVCIQVPFPRVRLGVAISFALVISSVTLSWACTGPSSVADPIPRLIAHSGGIGNHRTYTNSLEALNNSVARGHTVIEVDLSWTSDEHLVLLHDWGHEFGKLFNHPPGRLSLVEFRSLPSVYGVTHLSFSDLAAWMLDNPGVLIVTDIKERNAEGLRLIAKEFPGLRHRVIPQIYQPDSYLEIREIGYHQVIFSLYRTDLTDCQVVEFASINPVVGVTMPARRAMESSLPTDLAKIGVRAYAHTVNDHLTVKTLQSKGVYGVYTDWLTPSDEGRSGPLGEWWVQTEGEVPLDGLVVPFLPWKMAGMETTVGLHNTGENPEMVYLRVLDSGGRLIVASEFEVLGNDNLHVDLNELVSDRASRGWLHINATDGTVVHPRWRFLDRTEGVWTSERAAQTRFESGGSSSNTGGFLVAVLNPTDSIQSYRLRRFIGVDPIDDDIVDLEPQHQMIRVYRSQTDEDTQLTVTGAPMVAQVLRWDPMGRYMR